jgi:hypothetical protein
MKNPTAACCACSASGPAGPRAAIMNSRRFISKNSTASLAYIRLVGIKSKHTRRGPCSRNHVVQPRPGATNRNLLLD